MFVDLLSGVDFFCQLLLFLLNSSMIDLLEILLFLKFVISTLGFLCDDPGLVELLLQLSYLVTKLKIVLEDLRNIWQLRLVNG